MFIGNLYIDATIDKTLMYVTGETGESRRYHLFNIGFDHYCRDNPVGSAWCFNLTIPFASFTVGWVFKNKAA
ncbi:hypothetical protein PP410_gp13 [Vibrio phage NF]|uniref:Uncharacterized protein n=1 Tax=Vibrio phage NF TaxID=2686202 RepID=A0A6B9IZZ4_9CAUD|nr:hypothetical protein PP410_gp13 [Vibrio phage NF]QGZ13230.1 hypothetical protein [Vibrio phage NF]